MKTIKIKLYSFIVYLSTLTKTDLVYLTTGGFWLIVEQIVSSITSFILVIIFARFLDQSTFGNYNYVHSILGILTIISLPGINSVLSQSIAKGYDSTIFLALKTKIKWSLIVSALALMFGFYYFINSNSELGNTFLFMALFFPIFISAYVYDAYLKGKALFKTFAVFESAYQLIHVLAIAITIFFSKNLAVIFFVYFLTISVSRLFFLKLTLNLYPSNNKIDSKAINYGKHQSLINALGTLASYLDKIIVFYFLGPVNLAIYAFATIPIDKFITISDKISSLALPKFSKTSLGKINEILINRIFQLMIFGISMTLVYYIAAPTLFKVLFPKYLDSIHLSQLYSVCLIFKLPTLLLASFGQSKITLYPKK